MSSMIEMVRDQLGLTEDEMNEFILEVQRYVPAEGKKMSIPDFLMQIGITPNLKGFSYLIEAVSYCLEKNTETFGWTTDVYPEVAKRKGTTPSRTERAIRHAIEKAYEADTYLLGQVVKSISPYRGKATNAEFISALVVYFK